MKQDTSDENSENLNAQNEQPEAIGPTPPNDKPKPPRPPHHDDAPFAEWNCSCLRPHKYGIKLLIALLIFLAGMGFNAMFSGSHKHCHHKMPNTPAMQIYQIPDRSFSNLADPNGTVVIINTDGNAQIHSPQTCGCGMHKKHSDCPLKTKPASEYSQPIADTDTRAHTADTDMRPLTRKPYVPYDDMP